MCQHAVKKSPYLLTYVPDQYKTRQMQGLIIENHGTLKSVPDSSKNQEMCNEAVDTYYSVIKFVPECFMTQEYVINHLIDDFLYFILFLINKKLKKYVTELLLKILFLIVYFLDKYKTKEMCDKAIDDSLAAFALIPDSFVTSKMIKILLLLYTQMKTYSIFMKILVMLFFM